MSLSLLPLWSQEGAVTADARPASRPNPDYLARAANRRRMKLRPAEPTDVNFAVETDFLPPNFVQQDIRVDKQRHLVFATTAQLDRGLVTREDLVSGQHFQSGPQTICPVIFCSCLSKGRRCVEAGSAGIRADDTPQNKGLQAGIAIIPWHLDVMLELGSGLITVGDCCWRQGFAYRPIVGGKTVKEREKHIKTFVKPLCRAVCRAGFAWCPPRGSVD